jgi:hypothetical protein
VLIADRVIRDAIMCHDDLGATGARLEREGRTTVALDHTGFPVGQADHLASGWYANYWNPLHALPG